MLLITFPFIPLDSFSVTPLKRLCGVNVLSFMFSNPGFPHLL